MSTLTLIAVTLNVILKALTAAFYSSSPPSSRSLPSEAMSSAALFNCLYLEISASLDHRTQELLECAVRLTRGQSPWPPGTSAEDMSGSQRESITSRAKRFLSGLVPRYPREREVSKFMRQKSRSCHDLGALWPGAAESWMLRWLTEVAGRWCSIPTKRG